MASIGGRPPARTRWAAAAAAALALSAPALAAGPDVDARAYLVRNGEDGEILLRHNDRARVPIASITKLMTVLVALERSRPGDLVTITDEAAAVGESTISLVPGERLTVLELVKAALIQSANDAATALAVHAGGGSLDRFVALMNARARTLGLRDTHFVRPDGLDTPGHLSSARDATLLGLAAMRNPVIRKVVRMKTAVISGNRTLRSWNDLLGRFPGLLGVKTGHTSGAGWSEVAAAAGGGVTVYATVLGSPTRAQRNSDLAELLAWGLSRYRSVAVVQRGRVYRWAKAPYGRAALAIVAPRRVVRIVRIDRPLLERVTGPTAVALPVAKGQRLGTVEVFYGRKLIARSPLVATRAIPRPGLAGRVGWYSKRTLSHLWGFVT